MQQEEFLYRRLTEAEKTHRTRTCQMLKANKMACGVKAMMRVTQNNRPLDLCMSHFIREFQEVKNDDIVKKINLDETATAQELQLRRKHAHVKE